jgi:hypothetical protein
MSRGTKIALVVGGLAIVAMVGVGVAVVIGMGFGAMRLIDEGAPGLADENEQVSAMIALGEGRAVFVYGHGISMPIEIRGVHREGAGLATDWTHRAAPGLGTYGWKWRTAGDIVVGELHPTQGNGPHRLVVLHRERGMLGEIEGVSDGAWILSEDGAELLVYTGDAVALHRTAPFAQAWRTPVRSRNVLARLGLTPSLAVAYDGAIHVLRRDDGSVVRDITEEREVTGIDRARGELLFLRNGRIVVESLETGAERITLDLAEGAALVDGMEEPTLLGSHGGRWLVQYSTELDHSFTNAGAPTWTRNAPRTLAAVDPETGVVAWRSALGPWPRWRPIWNQELYDERALPAELLMYSDSTAEGGAIVGHLAYVSLTDGALRWQLDYPHATRGNALFANVGDVAYLRIREANDGSRSALARFEDGRLTGAVWLADFGGDVREPMLRSDEAWIPSGMSSWALVGADLRERARGGPEPAPSDARAWVSERLGL